MSSWNDLRLVVEAIALENAIEHDGKPSLNAVVKKFLSTYPNYRSIIKELLPYFQNLIDSISQMNLDDQLNRFNSLKHYLPEKRRIEIVREELPPIPCLKYGNVVTRFAPNPDFVLHLGSLRPLVLSYEYAKKYRGKFILRFEDTDPRLKRPELTYYELILKDLEWLNIFPDEIHYQSDRLEIYYDFARKLMEIDAAYVCLCKKEKFNELVIKNQPCPHRMQSVEKNLEEFDKMLSKVYKEGEAVVRIKTDLMHPNISVRDWPALRIIDTEKYPHPRVGSKYTVWPLYNFSCAVDDYLMGVTLIFRGEEHRINEEKQRYIFHYMGREYPIAIHHGRIATTIGPLSKSKILKGIKEGLYVGIDDLRLATLASLRRRGIRPDALKNIIIKIGFKPGLSRIDWSLIASENRKLIEPIANRYFGARCCGETSFVAVINLDESPFEYDIYIRKHPSHPERGNRRILLLPENRSLYLYIDCNDIRYFKKGEKIRLIHLGNFIVEDRRNSQALLRYIDNDTKKAINEKYPFIHWVPKNYCIEATLVYPDATYEGYIEMSITEERPNNIIQLERIGYFKIDEISEGRCKLLYMHK
ncbi:MAG: glutamate--tRNA ligase [Candidatus Geothermarchaeota archaeon]